MAKNKETHLKDMREVFSQFDKDGNGYICTRELSKVLRSLGQKPTDQELKSLIAQVDKDGNGTLNFKEFLEIVDTDMLRNTSKKLPSESEILAAFQKFDKDGNGFISAVELRQTLNSLNMKADDKLSEFEATQLVQQADIDGNNVIDYQEFIKMMFGDDN